MRGHGRTLRETLLADWATKRLFPAVCSQVGSEIGSLGESFSTHITTIRLFTGVGSHVCLQRRRPGVAFPTNLAHIVASVSSPTRLASWSSGGE